MSKPATIAQRLWPAATWSVAPALWALNTQLAQIFPGAECRGTLAIWSLTLYAGGALLLAIAIAIAAYRWKDSETLVSKHERAETSAFIAYGGALLSLVFAFALLLQWAATWILAPCEV